MYIVNGIAYAREISENISVTDIKVLNDMVLIVTFSTWEQRLFDATCLLEYPAFEPLKNEEIFKTAKVEYGVVVWNDGDIDIAPETMYQKSYAYTPIVA